MEYCYYKLEISPDLSLSKYGSLSETGPSGVITQHQAFWRQMGQWGKLFGGSIHFVYYYDADQPYGKRMRLILRFDAPTADAIRSVRQIMKASILQPYYDTLVEDDASCLPDKRFAYAVNLKKKEYFISSERNPDDRFYTVSEWEMNGDARLYSMLRLMAASDVSSAYCVDLYPMDYEADLEKALEYILPHLRQLNTFKVDKSNAGVSTGTKDESAKKAVDFYDGLMDELSSSPHFLANIQVFSDLSYAAKQMIDAAASEALSKGNYALVTEQLGMSVREVLDQGFCTFSDTKAPASLADLPNLFILEHITPFAMMPVLFPGEDIEMPKETVPKLEDGMFIGIDDQNHRISVPWKNLSKHAFMAGMPGSGKTNTMMYLISQIFGHNVPILVLEPAKREYRSLLTKPEMSGVSLFSPSANSMFPLHINPFRFPKGMKLADHIGRLLDVFNGTFQLDPPMPMLLTEAIQLVYERLGWLPGMVNEGKLPYPTMSQLYSQIEKLFDKYQYADEIRSNLQSVLQVRIGSLLAREMGDIFDVEDSTFAEEEWLEKSAVIELASLGSAAANFLILLLLTLIRESLDVIAYDPEKWGKGPRHAIFLEEAHNLIANKSVQENGSIDPKISATAFIVKMLAEVRSLGETIVIADQLPTAMAPEVVKNTSLKFGLRLTSQDERELLGSSMSADAFQMERMGVLTPGKCYVCYEGLLKPFEMQVPEYKGDSILTDIDLQKLLFSRSTYHRNMLRSAEIMVNKFGKRRAELAQRKDGIIDEINDLSRLMRTCSEAVSENSTVPASTVNLMKQNEATIHKELDSLLEEMYHFLAEVSIYSTVGLEIRHSLDIKRWAEDYTEEQRNEAHAENKRWRDLITLERNRIKEDVQRADELYDLFNRKSPGSDRSKEIRDMYSLRLSLMQARFK